MLSPNSWIVLTVLGGIAVGQDIDVHLNDSLAMPMIRQHDGGEMFIRERAVPTSNCGHLVNDPTFSLTCRTGYCGFNSISTAAGCCTSSTTISGSQYLAGCAYATQCMDSTYISRALATQLQDTGMLICSNSASPYCQVYTWFLAFPAYTNWECGATFFRGNIVQDSDTATSFAPASITLTSTPTSFSPASVISPSETPAITSPPQFSFSSSPVTQSPSTTVTGPDGGLGPPVPFTFSQQRGSETSIVLSVSSGAAAPCSTEGLNFAIKALLGAAAAAVVVGPMA